MMFALAMLLTAVVAQAGGLPDGVPWAVARAAPASYLYPYLDRTKTWDFRVADLVGRLSLEEKVAQLLHDAPAVDNVNGAQIPAYEYWTECNTGIGIGYPQNINMAATWNRSLVFEAGRSAGVNLRAHANGNVSKLSCWSPMINIMRHPLWGRNHEGYGEDPYLSGEMAFANVRGLQGHGLDGYPQFALAAAGCKHFSTFDGPANLGDAVITDQDWFWNYLPQFEQCTNAGAYSLMCSYSYREEPRSAVDPETCEVIEERGCFVDTRVPGPAESTGCSGTMLPFCGLAAAPPPPPSAGHHRPLPQATMTRAKCAALCQSFGFTGDDALVGVENRGECYCARDVPGGHAPLIPARSSSECNMPCAGNQTEMCGGPSRLSLFKARCTNHGIAPPDHPLMAPVSGCANHRALTTVLRNTWSSKEPGVPGMGRGFVVSDCGAVHDARASITAGCDLECGNGGSGRYLALANLTRMGLLNESVIDRALSRVLYVRMRLGEWAPAADVPFRNASNASAYSKAFNAGPSSHDPVGGAGYWHYEKLSHDAAAQSLVLLKNTPPPLPPSGVRSGPAWHHALGAHTLAAVPAASRAVLPLDLGVVDTIAVVGIETYMGAGYSTANGRSIPTSAALAAALRATPRGPAGTKRVTATSGCDDGPRCSRYNRSGVRAAAAAADVAVVFVGTGGLEGEKSGLGIDIFNLTLLGHQQQMVSDVLDAGPRYGTVVVLLTCNPVNITGIVADDRVSAVIHAGYPQHTGGSAIADMLLGAFNPSGKLVYTWPRGDAVLSGEAGELGNYTMLGTNKTYRYGQPDPLFPFGFGLHFTTFAYSDLVVTKSVAACSNVTVAVTVTNMGELAGSETVMLFVSWIDPVHPTPALQLANFDKVHIEASGQRRVTMVLDPRRMAQLETPPFTTAGWRPPFWSVNPGQLVVHVGGGQPGVDGAGAGATLNATVTVTGEPSAVDSCPDA